MAKLRIYINKEQTDKKGLAMIYFQIEHKGKRLKISSKIKSAIKDWNEKKGRIKGGEHAFADNLKLDHYEADINRIIHDNPNFDLDRLKKDIKVVFEPVVAVADKSFMDYFEQWTEHMKGKVTDGTQRHYVVMKNTLNDFSKKRNYHLDFLDMDKAFLEAFTSYLFDEKDLLNNTVEKRIKWLKTFLKWVEEDLHLPVNPEYKKFKWSTHNKEPMYLTETELMHFYNFKFENSRHEKVRDLFCFGCWTGLRFSDIMQVNKALIKNDAVHVNQQKVSELKVIPLNQYSRAILEKYDYDLPKITNQKANAYLKEAAKLAELKELAKVVQFQKKRRIETTAPKYDLLSFHDARRTFIILLLIKGIAHRVIMQMSGHTDIKSFEKYIKISDSVTTDAMKQAWG